MKKIKILISEDQVIVREGLKSLLNSNAEFEIVAEAGDGLETINCAKKYLPDLILLDLAMPKMNGISAIKEIKRDFPEIRILALTFHKSDDYIHQTFNAGADGYCLKSSTYDELVLAIKAVSSGGHYISPEISGKVLKGYLRSKRTLKSDSGWETLTQREKEVLKLVGEGYRSHEIGKILCISTKTVEKHRSNIMRKLDIHNASSLTAYAIEKGLVN